MKKQKKFDIIIIGSGIGGLMFGSLISDKKKVLLLEKDSNFGGYCSSFRRGTYNFEIGIEAINGLNNGQFIRQMFNRSGVLKSTVFTKPKSLYRAIYPDYDINVPQSNIDKYKQILYSKFSNEKKGIEGLIKVMGAIYSEIEYFDKVKKLTRSPYIMKYYKNTFKELLDEFITDERLRTIISQYWVYCGIPPQGLSAITFSYIWYDYTCNGSFYPTKGMGNVVEQFVKVIRENGGKVIQNAEVKKIYNTGDKANEIELADKKRYEANLFVSNIDARHTFDMLSDKNQKISKYIQKLESKEPSISAFKIYLGLDANLEKLGISDSEVFLNPSYDLDKMYKASLENRPDAAPLSIVVYSNLVPRMYDKNKSVVSIAMLSGYESWSKFGDKQYKTMKDELADNIIQRAEKVIPKLRQYIKERVIATPRTMERYTGNSKGAIYGWSKGNLYDEIRFMKVTTPIKNLLLSSHWTKIGGGVAGVVRAAERAYRSLVN